MVAKPSITFLEGFEIGTEGGDCMVASSTWLVGVVGPLLDGLPLRVTVVHFSSSLETSRVYIGS